MAYPVNYVADYIIERSIEINDPVNNLKLQKILYFLEARFLCENRGSLFNESIEKWKYGPVIPEVYYRFNHLGAEDITHVPLQFDFMSLLDDSIDISEHNDQIISFENDEKEIIDNTIDRISNYRAFDLVDETHRHPSWLDDEPKIISNVRHIKYDRKEILSDFERFPEFKLWVTNE